MHSSQPTCYATLLVLLALGMPGVAAAQSAVHGDGANALSATAVEWEQAQQRFTRGKDLFDEGRFEEALDEFAASRAIVASPNTLLYKARCQIELGRLVEAYAELGRVIIEGLELAETQPRYKRAAESASAERAKLANALAFAALSVHQAGPRTEISINGQPIRRTAWAEPTPVMPGQVKVTVRAPERENMTVEADASAGQTLEITINVEDMKEIEQAEAAPEPAVAPMSPPDPGPEADSGGPNLAPYAWIAGGLGVAGFAAFGVFGSKAKKIHTDLDDKCDSSACTSDESRLISKGERQQLFANIGLAVGAVGLATSVTLFVLDGPGEREESHAELVITPNWLGVRGRL